MDIIISNAGGQPIYEQICRQIKGAIASGRLKPGEPLPSIRALELAKESNLREIEAHLQAAVELGRQIELTVDDLQNILKVLSEEE